MASPSSSSAVAKADKQKRSLKPGDTLHRVPEVVFSDLSKQGDYWEQFRTTWRIEEEREDCYIIDRLYMEEGPNGPIAFFLEKELTGCYRKLGKTGQVFRCLDGMMATVYRSDNDYGAVYLDDLAALYSVDRYKAKQEQRL
jgi:hypothetical protein